MKIIIRPFESGDESELAFQANNIKIYNNVRNIFPHPYTLKDAQNWTRINEKIIPAENLAIVVNGKIAGGIGLILGTDIHCKNAEIGYFLGESYWGKGITTEAVGKFINYIFNTFPVTRIFAPTFDYNTASQRVLAKNGFTLESKHRKSLYKNKQYFDEFVFALLKENYKG